MSPLDVEAVAPAHLAEAIEGFLETHPAAALLEDGRVAFDLRTDRWRVSQSHGRCLLELWGQQKNLVRTVVEVRQRGANLRVVTRQMGTAKTQTLELVSTANRRPATTRESSRRHYQRLLERVLGRVFAPAKVDGLRSAMDLEHSFGPAYVRGWLLRGNEAKAVIGVSATESGAMVDGVLTLAILWLEHCRQKGESRRFFSGVKVIVPAGAWRTTAERMAWLNHDLARFELYALDERSEDLEAIEFRDSGNLESRLVHAYDAGAVLSSCQQGLGRVLGLLPEGARPKVEIRATSATEVGLFLHGLEFARVRRVTAQNGFGTREEICFGAGANETPLSAENEALFAQLAKQLFQSRYPDGVHGDALFRMQPERWLESELRARIDEVLPGVRRDLVCSQVPAIGVGDRGLLDLLTLDRNGRLTVIEVKTSEALHLPLQALDYWIRVRALNANRLAGLGGGRPRSAFERAGYFTGSEVSELNPRLVLAAPALRIHPANEPVLRSLSAEIDWELVALGEQWRRELRVIFRKRGGTRGNSVVLG